MLDWGGDIYLATNDRQWETCRKVFLIYAIMFAIPSGVENAHFNSELTGGPGGPGLPCGPSLPWNRNTCISFTCITQTASSNKVCDCIESQGETPHCSVSKCCE